MNKKDFDILVDRKLITEIGDINFYNSNPEKLEQLTAEDLVQSGILSQPATNASIIEHGIDVLTPTVDLKILTQNDLINAMKNNSFVKLTNDIELDDTIIWEDGDVTLDLNGYTLKGGLFKESGGEILEGNTDSYVFWIKSGNLTIQGQGKVLTQSAKYAIAVWANGGNVYIKNGEYINDGEGSDLVYASAGGNVYISGGIFKPNPKQEGVEGTLDNYTALNIKDKDRNISNIEVSGGIFYNFDPSSNLSEGLNTNFVVDGYKAVEVSENVFRVIKE